MISPSGTFGRLVVTAPHGLALTEIKATNTEESKYNNRPLKMLFIGKSVGDGGGSGGGSF